jgi:hypothetical protein
MHSLLHYYCSNHTRDSRANEIAIMEDSADITVCDSTTFDSQPKQPYQPIVWRNVILCSLVHLGALYGVYLAFASAKTTTTIFGMFTRQ